MKMSNSTSNKVARVHETSIKDYKEMRHRIVGDILKEQGNSDIDVSNFIRFMDTGEIKLEFLEIKECEGVIYDDGDDEGLIMEAA